MSDSSLNTYSTKDTALAAYLYAEGFELIEVTTDRFPTIFHFKNDNPRIHEFAHKYRTGRGDEVSASVFFRAYKHVLREISDNKKRRL